MKKICLRDSKGVGHFFIASDANIIHKFAVENISTFSHEA